jgi:hypothetical protein
VAHDVGRVEIKTRGMAISPDELGRRLHLKGSRPAVVLLTRLGEKPTAILAERV